MSDRDASFQIAYDGPALKDHEMDVKELAPALLSIGELLEDVNRVLNPPHVKMVVNMRATKAGSVDIDLVAVQSLIDQARNLFASDTVTAVVNAKEILSYVFGGLTVAGGGVIGLIKWLKGRKVKNVTRLETGDYQIVADGGEMRVTNEKELTLFRTFSIRQKIETFIRKPMQVPGIDQVKITTPDTVEVIDEKDADYFVTPATEQEALQDVEMTFSLQLIGIAFQGDYKWRFNDGTSTFMADMLDVDFRQRVEKNEVAFAKDDIFIARVRIRQFIVGGELKSERSILKVIDYRSAASARMRLPGI